MKNLTILAVVLLLLVTLPAFAQDDPVPTLSPATVEDAPATIEDAAEDIPLPGWVEALAFGTLSLSLVVTAATEVVKRVLQLLGFYQDGWGRYIVIVVTCLAVGAVLIGDLFGVSTLVNEKVAWLYQLMLLLLTLLGAPTAHTWAQKTGLLK